MDAPPVAIVIGSGFGGAVTACRLAEADYNVTVLERGRRYEKGDFPRYPTDAFFSRGEGTEHSGPPVVDLSRWLWKRDQGIYDVRDLEDVVSVQAAGYGGGSLIYANVHLRPPREVFARWPAEYHEGKLDPYFDLAALMLQVKPIPRTLAKTSQLFRAANALNSEAFLTPLAVNFERCDLRGRCCLGCDQQAKNTLDMNYLERAERRGPRS